MALFVAVVNCLAALTALAGILFRLPLFAEHRRVALLALMIVLVGGSIAYDATLKPGWPGYIWVGAYVVSVATAFVAVIRALIDRVRDAKSESARRDHLQRLTQWSMAHQEASTGKRVAEEAEFFSELGPSSSRVSCKVDGIQHMLVLGGASLSVIRMSTSAPFTVWSDEQIPFNQIVSAEMVSKTGYHTSYTTEEVQRFQNKKKSPVGRALVGGLVAGPLGAIVGAVSGVGGTLQVKNESKVVAHQTAYEAGAEILVGTANPHIPLIRIEFVRSEDAQEWLYRLRGAMAQGTSISAG